MKSFHQFNEDYQMEREPTGPWVVLKKGSQYWVVGNYPRPGEMRTVEKDTRVHCYHPDHGGTRPSPNGMTQLGTTKDADIQFSLADTK